MRRQVIVLAAALIMAPLGARAADLVVWWEEGYYPQEDEAVREIIAAFEQETGKQVELVFYPTGGASRTRSRRRSRPASRPTSPSASLSPTSRHGPSRIGSWTSRTPSATSPTCSIRTRSTGAVLLNAADGAAGAVRAADGRTTNHIHVWKSLLEQAGFTLEDIPKEWDAFWSFWCDQVQPAVRRATGRDDIWGVGLHMSVDAADTGKCSSQFVHAYEADYVTHDGRLVIDDPEVRQQAGQGDRQPTRRSIARAAPRPIRSTWAQSTTTSSSCAQAVVMTLNHTLSIPNALKRERPEDYYENTATIEWPLGPDGEPLSRSEVISSRGVVFKGGGNVATAKEFVRFLVAEGWLAHYLDFAGERMLPPIPKLLDAPFWLDPSDPHRMAAVMRSRRGRMQHDYVVASGDWRYDLIWQEKIWAKAVHRVAAEGISPEQAVDEAIARIKQILSESRAPEAATLRCVVNDWGAGSPRPQARDGAPATAGRWPLDPRRRRDGAGAGRPRAGAAPRPAPGDRPA